ncbi:hypothetical protein OIU78_016338 [Salix suchowensis]|nr:hypothetical protein OIU78_016338 [Salix suchowensis]
MANNTLPNSSWADKVRVSDANSRHTLDSLPRQVEGKLHVPKEALQESTGQWTRCMVGFFPRSKMAFHAVRAIATRAWKNCGLESVIATSIGFFIFRFKDENDLHAVMEKGLWMFGGRNIILQQWHPRLLFDKTKIATIPVWIHLHGLPFPMWTRQGLSMATSMVGKPLSCDAQTFSCTRLEYARVCVELDAAHPITHKFEVDYPLSSDPITVEVDYEWKPSRCSKCKYFGHSCHGQHDRNETGGEEPKQATLQGVATPEDTQSLGEKVGTDQTAQNPNPPVATSDNPIKKPKPKQPQTVKPIPVTTSATSHYQNNPAPPVPSHPPKPKNQQKKQTTQRDKGEGGYVIAQGETLGLEILFQEQICTVSRMVSPSCSIADQDIPSTLASSQSSPATSNSPTKIAPTVRKKKSGRKRREAKGF